MSPSNHPDFKIEEDRLSYILEYIKDYLIKLSQDKLKADREAEYAAKHYSADNSQGFIDLMLNKTFQHSLSNQLRNVQNFHNKPYFARVDFTENQSNKHEKIYIGKMSLMRDEDKEMLIIDWRAPIANLYYEGRLGDASYLCPDGQIHGKIHLKRQLSIEDSKLKDIFDIDITTNDQFLQASLGASADNRLKDIVSTIQEEQNKIIRSEMWKPLIVQGAAGSGKTTIALHRIAYLIYTHEKEFHPKDFMIIAPSRLFLNYISEVLPELGVENVYQTTFEDFAVAMLEKKVKIADSHQKLADFVDNNTNQQDIIYNHSVKDCSTFKGSILFRDIIDRYIKRLEQDLVPDQDFTLGDYTILSKGDILKLFVEEYKYLPMDKRLDEIKKHLNTGLKNKKQYLLDKVQLQCDKRVEKLKLTMEPGEERQKLIIDTIDKKNALLEKIAVVSKSAVKSYMDKLKPKHALDYYKQLFENNNLLEELSQGSLDQQRMDFIKQYSSSIFSKGFIEIEDVAPILYIKHHLKGPSEKIKIKHVVIDEAQDFSLFQLYALKTVLKTHSFTILGDLCQGIHSYRGLHNWDDVAKYIFEKDMRIFLTLEQSYRTTVEIMEAANSVVKFLRDDSLPLGKPVIRHGLPVQVNNKQSLKEVAKDIMPILENLNNDGFGSAAIICKTMEECLKMKDLLKACKVPVYVINGKEKQYTGGIVITPSYLVKGLEFDVVIISNCSEQMYKEEELDIKLLYVAMTRPLHNLYIYSVGQPSPLLRDIDRQ